MRVLTGNLQNAKSGSVSGPDTIKGGAGPDRSRNGNARAGKSRAGRLLEIGIALCPRRAGAMAANDALPRDARAAIQLAQNVPPAATPPRDPAAMPPARNAPSGNAPGPAATATAAEQAPPPDQGMPQWRNPARNRCRPKFRSRSTARSRSRPAAARSSVSTLPAANIYVADPKVAEVRPASSTSLFVFGVGAGHTTIAAVDQLGRLLADYDITVRPSASARARRSRRSPG